MPVAQLTPLDTSFLAVESETAHMHVGWVCEFAPPASGPAPGFWELRDHIQARLHRAPRYRQRLESMPLGVGSPHWVDDEHFELGDHLRRDVSGDLMKAAATSLSRPLSHDKPLWEMTIVEGLPDSRLGVVGKAHHCMVDGVAAVELASLLLDPEPDPEEPPADRWSPEPPGRLQLAGRWVLGTAADAASTLSAPLRAVSSPGSLGALPAELESLARAGIDALRPAERTALNRRPLSPKRHLGTGSRPLEDLREIRRRFDVTINDVLLAAACGAMRTYLAERGEEPGRLKTMVPVNVRSDGEGGPAGNRISFMFVDLPCEEPDPVRRLERLAAETSDRKQDGRAEAAETILDGIGRIPNFLRGVVARLAAGPRTFDLTVSNIPGPAAPMYMRGCRLQAAYPVVPIPDRRALSIGMTSIGERACFGLYADRELVPDVVEITERIDAELDALLRARPSLEPEREPDAVTAG